VLKLALALTALLLIPAPAASRPATYGASLGSHSMIYLNSTPDEQETMFRATARAGLRYLRMDFAVGLVYAWGNVDFSAVDRVNALAERYDVEVLGVITTTPWYIAACPGTPFDDLDRCAPAPRRERRWRRMVARIARRATNVRIWELGNEPDGTFIGGPAEYARWAALAADGIRGARPDAQIAIGGFARLDPAYIAAALNDPRHPLLERVDIANIHLRVTLSEVSANLATARAIYRDAGFDGPLWVTETGYPSRPAHQWEVGFQRGRRDQGRWLAHGLPALVDGGADAVFVAFRDNHEFGRSSPFSSEGLLTWPRARAKPALATVRRLAALSR
jgi:hypothetical protein